MHRVNFKHWLQRAHIRNWTIAIVVVVAIYIPNGSCLFGTATNLCEKSSRRCDPGQTCAANQDICIVIGGCGDGIIDPDKGEVCDDGNIVSDDGCSSDCKSKEICGNHIIDINETCDDGNTIPGDGCSADCQLETCGNGRYEPSHGEQCDTMGDTQACNGNGLCSIPKCGDNYVNVKFIPFGATAPEQCDDEPDPNGKLGDTSTCNGNHGGQDGPGSCRFPSCGDGYVNTAFVPPDAGAAEQCDELDQDGKSRDSQTCNGNNRGHNGSGSCQIPFCGDHYKNEAFVPPGATMTENCDEGPDDKLTCNGNNHGHNGIGSCRSPSCGDGYVNQQFAPSDAGVEQCDTGSDSPTCNGNHLMDDAGHVNNPTARCQMPKCGDGYVNPTFEPSDAGVEQCDTGSDSPTCNGNHLKDNAGHVNNPTAQCQVPKCGDGYLNPGAGEQCDPGDSKHPLIPCPAASQSCNNCKCLP